jgi:hypothetical protein
MKKQDPKPGIKATSSQVKILRNFAEPVWFDETLYELVRLELQAFEPATFGFGGDIPAFSAGYS